MAPNKRNTKTLHDNSKAKINLDKTKEFLRVLAPSTKTFTFQTYADSDAKNVPAKVLHGTLAEHAADLQRLNKKGACIAVTINATEGSGRKTQDVIGIRAVFVDLDDADLEPVKKFKLKPHLIVKTSKGRYHAYWRVDDLSLDQFEGVQRAIAECFGGDDVHDLPRSMRLPGFLHQKGEPYRVRLLKARDKAPYSAKKILREFPPAKVDKSKATFAKGGKITKGERNTRLTSLGGSMVSRGMSAGAILAALSAENQERCSPPVAENEIAAIAASVERYRGDSDREALLDELAELSPTDYDKKRKAVAKELGIRVGTLDQEVLTRGTKDEQGGTAFLEPVEPWREPVEGEALLNEVAATYARYVVLPKGAVEALALWTLHAHAHDAAEISPILAISSPTRRCGKTTLLRVLEELVPKPLSSSNVTMATVFRAIEKWSPTLLLDEADSFLRENDDLRGVLDSGHTKSGAFVLRCVGDAHEPKVFRTWAPKVIALIGKLPPTLEDRAIHINMKRRLPSEPISHFPKKPGAFLELHRQCARWAQDHFEKLKTAEPEIPPGLHDRAADNWGPLLAIADEVGGEWPEQARWATGKLEKDTEDDAVVIMLLEDIETIFDKAKDDKMPSTYLIDKLEQMLDRPWPEFGRTGKPITAAGVARLLKPFGIRTKQLWMGDRNCRGYRLRQFRNTFKRYLPLSTR